MPSTDGRYNQKLQAQLIDVQVQSALDQIPEKRRQNALREQSEPKQKIMRVTLASRPPNGGAYGAAVGTKELEPIMDTN